MKTTVKLAAATILSMPLIMVGCTCSQQESPDQVVPMEDPVATPEDMEGVEEEAPPESGMAPSEDVPPAEGTEGTEEGHSEGDGHAH